MTREQHRAKNLKKTGFHRLSAGRRPGAAIGDPWIANRPALRCTQANFGFRVIAIGLSL
jgi:hypothetical protein